MPDDIMLLLTLHHDTVPPPSSAYCSSKHWPLDEEGFTISPPLDRGHLAALKEFDTIPYAIRNVVMVLERQDGIPISFHELCFSVLHNEITVARVVKTLRDIGVVEVRHGRRRPRGEMRAQEETYIKWIG